MKNNLRTKKFIIVFIVLIGCFLIAAGVKEKNQRKYWSAESKDGKWGLYAVEDEKGFWEGFLIYFGNTSGNIGEIKISGTIGEEKREEKINAEEYINDYKKIVSKTRGKTSYYSVVIWGSDTPDIMLKIYYYEQGEAEFYAAAGRMILLKSEKTENFYCVDPDHKTKK